MSGHGALRDALGDRYAIERELGHGATATVYLARDLKFDRLVALKVLSPDFALAVSTERFQLEIDTTAKLSHPHIVPLFDGGMIQGIYYYVMPYIRGESLRERLAREGPLAIDDALRLTRQVAGALSHAHRHGVIHRDIKPANILLQEGHAWAADFGIARAIMPDDATGVTATGVAVGTPAYMSPEQASGDRDLDGRSDVYSLGCVFYEMLTGAPPFTGPNVQAVLTKHLTEPLWPARVLRPEIPERVEQIVEVALAKAREDRFPTAGLFAEALSLEGAGPLTPTRTQPVRPRRPRPALVRTLLTAGVTLVIGGAGVAVIAAVIRPELNPTRYLVVGSAEDERGMSDSLDVERLLRDALNEWRGITVLGRAEVGATGRPVELARRARAGWYVRVGTALVGDSLRVRGALYGTRGDSLVRERAVNIAPTRAGADSAFARLADGLLFEDTVRSANGGRAGTRSVAARQAFARGLSAVHTWDLGAADSAFRMAAGADQAFAQAHLWLAQVRYWNGGAPATWRSSVERVMPRRQEMSTHDREVAGAMAAFASGALGDACPALAQLATTRSSDFTVWYGLATCLKSDDVVVPDRRSESGWRFRSSYHQALKAYQRAFQLQPAILRSLRAGGFVTLRLVLMTSSARRMGRAAPPDTSRFLAVPAWRGDSLALIPFPVERRAEYRPSVLRANTTAALRRQREWFHDIATAWAAAFPGSAGAVEAVALSLEMLGDPACIDSLRRARALESDPGERLRLANAEVLGRLKFSVPSDLAGVRDARELADSLLAVRPAGPTDARILAGLAVLTGRAHLAADLHRQAATDLQTPGPIARSAPALVVYAAVGGPPDSIRVLAQDVERSIETLLPASERPMARQRWLARHAALAFPSYPLDGFARLAGSGYALLDAQAAYVRGDTNTVRRILENLRALRRPFPPAELTIDALYPEAALLAALGDSVAALAWLDPTLQSLAGTAPHAFAEAGRAGALVRAMLLRAELGAYVNEGAAATRWARTAAELWVNADAFLQPVVKRALMVTR